MADAEDMVINPDHAILLKRTYNLSRNDASGSLDEEIEASEAWKHCLAVQAIVETYFQGHHDRYQVKEYKGEIPRYKDVGNAVRQFHVEGEEPENETQLSADWTFFHAIRKPTRLSSAYLELQVTPSRTPLFDKIAKALEFASELHFPEGLSYEGGISLVKNGKVRDLERACCDIGHRHDW